MAGGFLVWAQPGQFSNFARLSQKIKRDGNVAQCKDPSLIPTTEKKKIHACFKWGGIKDAASWIEV